MDHDSFDHAEAYLKAKDFAAAVATFRRASLKAAPSELQLLSLGVAEEEDRMAFRRTLCDQHPLCIQCNLNLLMMLHKAGRSASTVHLASEMMSAVELSESELLRLRIIRLQAALAAAVHYHVVSDFAELWQAGLTNLVAYRCRKTIVAGLAQASAPELAGAFEELSRLPHFDESVVAFLRSKQQELIALGELQKRLRDDRDKAPA